MCARDDNGKRGMSVMMSIGLLLISGASGWRALSSNHPGSLVGSRLGDGLLGLMTGVGLGMMLVGLWRLRRRPGVK